MALFAIKETPVDIIAKLRDESIKALTDPSSAAILRAPGAEVVTSTPDELACLLQAELVKWKEVVTSVGARVE